MDYDLGDDAVQLRQHLRKLISNNVPADFLGACTEDPQDLATTETFCKLLAVEGLLALAWPKEHGGGGGSVWHQTVLREEMWAQHEPRGPQYMGINWVGPALMRYGTAQQKAKHLAAIASGDVIWCQGFSEPEPRCVPALYPMVMVGASTARKCGPRMPEWRPGACWRPAPTPTPRSPSGSPYF